MLFDGDCGICTKSSELVKWIDASQRFVVQPYQSFSEAELAQFGITYAQCDKKLQVIAKSGKVHQGAFAVNYFLWQFFPWRILVLLLYLVPPLLLLEIFAYWLIAQNRARISQWFGLRACLLKR